MSEVFEIVFMPWLSLGNTSEFKFASARVWNADLLETEIADPEIATQARAILSMYQRRAGTRQNAYPLKHIGVISVRAVADLSDAAKVQSEIQTLRAVLFICSIAKSLRFEGSNSGHEMTTAENYSLVSHRFERGSDRFNEIAGTIVRKTDIGNRVSETRFLMPTHVVQPFTFRVDERLKRGLELAHKHNRRLFNRIVRAGNILIEGYYNSPDLDMRARILLQTLAFEVLLDLPESKQRKELKRALEELHARRGERKFRYKCQISPGQTRPESRPLIALWADRLYMLRNKIIHGVKVSAKDFRFRGRDHFARSAPKVFIVSVGRLLDRWLQETNRAPVVATRLEWGVLQERDDYEEEDVGYRIRDDWKTVLAGSKRQTLG